MILSVKNCAAFFMIWHGDVSRRMTFCLGQSLANRYIGTLSHILEHGSGCTMNIFIIAYHLSYMLVQICSHLFQTLRSVFKFST